MELRDYQVGQAEALISGQHVLLESPTGSGKTLTVCYAAIALHQAGKKVIVSTSLKSSMDQFDQTIRKLGGEVEVGSTKSIRRSLRMKWESIVVCTHQTLRNVWDDTVVADDIYLFVDESHHAGQEQRLGEVCKQFVAAGGRLKVITASPFRADGLLYLPDNILTVRRTLYEHMTEGYAPGLVKSAIVTFKLPKFSKKEFCGESVSEEATKVVAEEMFQNWVGTKRKTVICLPSCKQTANLVQSIISRFSVGGARVLNAYGDNPSVREKFEGMLAIERDGGSADSRVDVIVGCNRVYESMDWPHCSQAYCYGAPNSPVKVLQLLGRTLRQKDSSSNKDERDESRLVFFLPSEDGTPKSLKLWHMQQSLLVCGLVYDATKAKLWSIMERIVKVRFPRSKTEKNPLLPDHGSERSKYIQLFQIARMQLLNENREVTPKLLVERMEEIVEDAEYDPLKVRQIVLEQFTGSSNYYLDLITKELEEWPTESMKEIFDSIVNSFSQSEAVNSQGFEGITLTPDVINVFGTKLNGLVPDGFYERKVYDGTWNRGSFREPAIV